MKNTCARVVKLVGSQPGVHVLPHLPI